MKGKSMYIEKKKANIAVLLMISVITFWGINLTGWVRKQVKNQL